MKDKTHMPAFQGTWPKSLAPQEAWTWLDCMVPNGGRYLEPGGYEGNTQQPDGY